MERRPEFHLRSDEGVVRVEILARIYQQVLGSTERPSDWRSIAAAAADWIGLQKDPQHHEVAGVPGGPSMKGPLGVLVDGYVGTL